MPKFDTPEPITARIEIAAGRVRLNATDRDDTLVEVRPCNESRAADVRAAERTRIDFAHGTLTVSAGRWGPFGARTGAVEIAVELPSRSRLDVSVASAQVRADGEYAHCRMASPSGDLAAGTTNGSVSVSTASGDASIGALNGDLTFQAASGRLTVERLHGTLKTRTASGSVAVATAVDGEISAHTASGEVEVGVAAGTAARLDIVTASGGVTSELQPSAGPARRAATLLLHVRTASGDVTVRRS